MKKIIINVLKFLLFLSIGLGILYLVYQNQNTAFQEDCALKGIPTEDCSLIGKVLEDFKNANYFWIAMVLLAFTISNVSRAIRWNMLIQPLGYRPRFINAFLSVVLNYFANLGLPRVGEVVRAGTMSKYEKIPLEKILGTLVVDRIIDVISILILTALVILLQYQVIWAFIEENANLSEKFGGIGNLIIFGMAFLLLTASIAWFFRKSILQSKIYQKILNLLKGFWEGLQTIRKLDRPWLFAFHSINIWFMYFLMTYLCFFSFIPTANLSPLVALVVFVAGGWGIVIPSPGGLGTYHFLAQATLMMYGVSGEDGFSWANISFFSIQIGCNVILGILAIVLLPIINRNYKGRPR